MKNVPAQSTSHPSADGVAIAAYCNIVFGYLEGLVPIRLIGETGTPHLAAQTEFVPVGNLASRLTEIAPRAAVDHRAVFVVPGTVRSAGSAKAGDIVQTGVLLIDLDAGDIAAKRAHLVRHIGVPTLEIASGGKTPDGQAKAHIYWRLTEAALGDDIALVTRLRGDIADKVGGDRSFASIHQPVRVGGTVHGKMGVLSPVRILRQTSSEYELKDLAERIDAMSALPSGASDKGARPVQRQMPAFRDLAQTPIREGSQDDYTRFEALSKVIGHWIRTARSGHCALSEARIAVSDYNATLMRPPWDEDRLRQEFEALLRKDIKEKGEFLHTERPDRPIGAEQGKAAPSLTEDAIAGQFVLAHAARLQFVPAWGQWFVWSGMQWRRDEVGRPFQESRLICRGATDYTHTASEARRLASAKTIAAVQKIAGSDPMISLPPDAFDRHPMLLNTPDGVMDLETGCLAPHDAKLLITQITAARLGAGCPRWLAFLREITGGDLDLQHYLARVAGYCLTGSQREQAFFFFYGSGANGKSVFLQTLANVLGNYAATATAQSFSDHGQGRHLTELAGLRAARMVLVSETESGHGWAEARIKAVTGGEKIRANFMHKDHFEFTPQFKLLVAGNHRPTLTEVGESMRRRLHVVPFAVTIPTDRRDARLLEILAVEADGILGWMVEGCAAWQKDGLAPPASVRDAAQDYFQTEDQLAHWLEECCIVGPDFLASSKWLFSCWEAWAKSLGLEVRSARVLGERLRAKGFSPAKPGGERGWRGITPKTSKSAGAQS